MIIKKSLENILGTIFLSTVLAFTTPAISNAQSNITKMGTYLRDNLGYVVHGTAVKDTVRLDPFNPNTGLSVRIVPELYISKTDAANPNNSMVKPFSITFTSKDSANKYSPIITFLTGNSTIYDTSVTAEQNAQKLHSILQGLTSVNSIDETIPQGYGLLQNYPNPFNPSTNISFKPEHDGQVRLRVYDMSGKELKTLVDEYCKAGQLRIVSFDASKYASGTYFYKLETFDGVKTKKMTLVK
jgi:hypothetical protein